MSLTLPRERSSLAAVEIEWRRGEQSERRDDLLAVEEPLEIRLAGYRVAVTMRTPGDDFDLAAGFLFTEGIIRGREDIADIHHCPTDDEESAGNIVNVIPSDPGIVDPGRWQRSFAVTSSCGVCGKAGIEAIHQRAQPIGRPPRIAAAALYRAAADLGERQDLFARTGGVHAAALCALDGSILLLREDVGRHNAADKIIGALLRAGKLPAAECFLLMSSRASFEIVQKAVVAGIPAVAAVSAASTLAVDLARRSNMILIGFLRTGEAGGRMNVYAGSASIDPERSA